MRRGFSSTEVLVGIAIFATALIPIITLIAGGTRPTAFNEYHVAAQSLASQAADRVVDRILTRGFADLEKVGIGESVSAEDTGYKLPVDPAAEKAAATGFVGVASVKLTNLAEPSGSLIRISATVPFTIPGDATKHSFTIERLLCRPEMGMMGDYVARQVGGGAVP